MEKPADKNQVAEKKPPLSSAPKDSQEPKEAPLADEDIVVADISPYQEVDWVDRAAILRDPNERQLLEQFRDAADEASAIFWGSTNWEVPVHAKRETKAAFDALRTTKIVLETLDRMRHPQVQNIIVVRGSAREVAGGIFPMIRDTELKNSDGLLNDCLTDLFEEMNRAAKHCRDRARSLRTNPLLPPRVDAYGRALGEDRTDWEERFTSLSHQIIREAAKLQDVILTRNNRGTQIIKVDDRRKASAPLTAQKSRPARRRKRPASATRLM